MTRLIWNIYGNTLPRTHTSPDKGHQLYMFNSFTLTLMPTANYLDHRKTSLNFTVEFTIFTETNPMADKHVTNPKRQMHDGYLVRLTIAIFKLMQQFQATIASHSRSQCTKQVSYENPISENELSSPIEDGSRAHLPAIAQRRGTPQAAEKRRATQKHPSSAHSEASH